MNKLWAFDEGGLARRALANNAFKPKDIVQALALPNPWDYFAYTLKGGLTAAEVESWQAPFDDALGITLRWQRDISEADKLDLVTQMLRTLPITKPVPLCANALRNWIKPNYMRLFGRR